MIILLSQFETLIHWNLKLRYFVVKMAIINYNYSMKCLCGSSKLQAHNSENLDYILNYVNGKWIASNPATKSYFFSSRRDFSIRCLDCNKLQSLKSIESVISPVLDHKEITLDLDHTLFHVEYAFELENCDFTYSLQTNYGLIKYYTYKRPHLADFIKILESRFEKINFFTAASEDYAKELIKVLNISSNKMGYLKTIKDTLRERCLSFDEEYMKPMENTLVVEDKPLVVKGYNNQIIKVEPYNHYAKKDDELLKVIKILSKKNKVIHQPEKMSGDIKFFVRDLNISFKDMPFDLYSKIIDIKSKTKDELNKLYIIVQEAKPSFEYQDNQGSFSFTDLTYDNYVLLYSLISPYSYHKLLSSEEYDQVLAERVKEVKKMFNHNN